MIKLPLSFTEVNTEAPLPSVAPMNTQISGLLLIGLLCLIPVSTSAHDDIPSSQAQYGMKLLSCFWDYPLNRLQAIVTLDAEPEALNAATKILMLNALASVYIARFEENSDQSIRRLKQYLMLSIFIEYLRFISPCLQEQLTEAILYKISSFIKNPLP